MAGVSENKVKVEIGETISNVKDANEQSETLEAREKASLHCDPSNHIDCPAQEDEELEEGELKDDDDDDDDDDHIDDHMNVDIVDGATRAAKINSDGSDAENRKYASSSSDSHKSIGKESCKSSARSSRKSSGIGTRRKVEVSSTRSSSSSIDRIHKPMSFAPRHGSTSGQTSRSHSRSKRRLSPTSDQARLVSMRAQLLEAKSREIEMKFQKNKVQISHTPTLSALSSSLLSKNLKTTLAKPPLTYAENPNPIECNVDTKKRHKSSKTSKHESKDRARSSKKSSKKRKRKKSTSSSRKKKRAKTSETRKSDTNARNSINSSTHLTDDTVNHVGPKTPPDNQVLTLDDEQVEWPSYLIKMTTTQPSISYSINPDSVADNSSASRPETSDLNADYQWYIDYFTNSFEMDKIQAHNQAYSILTSTSIYDRDLVERWLERQGFSRQSDAENEFGSLRDKDVSIHGNGEAPIPLRSTQPSVTTLKTNREIMLPNGKILPKGTVQKIVHPYPKTERVTPDLIYSNLDLY